MRKRDHYHVGNLPTTLLTEARALLEQSGPTKLSLREVATRAGVSSAAMYHHFANRSDLLAKLAALGFSELEMEIRGVKQCDTPRKTMVTLSQVYFGFAVHNPGLYQLMFGPDWTPQLLSDELTKARDAAFGALEQALAQALQMKVDAPSVRQAALGGWAVAHGLSMLQINKVLALPEGISNNKLVTKTLEGLNLLFEQST